MNSPRIKICGLSRPEDIFAVNEALPDFIGFVFAPSKRQISLSQAARLRTQLDERITAVGVFVDAPLEDILSAFELGVIDMAQLHGGEDCFYIEELKDQKKIPVIKALKVSTEGRLLQEPPSNAEYLLFDAQVPGSGTRFAWDEETINRLRDLRSSFILAGGINMDNLDEVLALDPWGIDISSGVEESGVKSAALIRKLVSRVREKEPSANLFEDWTMKEKK